MKESKLSQKAMEEEDPLDTSINLNQAKSSVTETAHVHKHIETRHGSVPSGNQLTGGEDFFMTGVNLEVDNTVTTTVQQPV